MDESNQSNSFLSPHLPLTLIAVAFCLFFVAQIQEAGIEGQGLDLQKAALTDAQDRLAKQKEKNAKELEDRKALVAQSENIQQQFADESKTVKDKTTTAAQFEALHKQIADMNKLLDDRKPLVEQSQKLQQQFSELMKDLDRLAREGDKDAALIINGYGIKVSENTPPANPPEKKPEEKKPEEKKPDGQ
jgi:hypothetical protein